MHKGIYTEYLYATFLFSSKPIFHIFLNNICITANKILSVTTGTIAKCNNL